MDFFISYNKADLAWAEWIAWQLDTAGYSTVVQAWDFRPGANFILEMQRAASEAERTIAVLSPDYLTSHFTAPEWAAALAKDALLPVRVRPCELKGLLPQIIYIDLVGLDETRAKESLLAGVQRGRAKPPTKPPFPGSGRPAAVAEAPRFPGALPGIWRVPFLRNPNFTGRDEQLRKLGESLAAPPAIVPIAGLGGTGKTQLALEYAYRHTADYDVVWWLRAEDPTTLAGDYAALAEPLGLADKAQADQPRAIATVRTWLEHHTRWLLTFDNALRAEGCRDYLPTGNAGHILITSRDQNWGGIAKPLKLDVWPRADALEFLRRRSGQDEPGAADKLCALLGDLPLALQHAGAYMEGTGMSVTEYLERYRDHPGVVHGPIAVTWQISVDRLKSECPPALDLLDLMAFLAPEDIDPELAAAAFPDVLEFDRARAALRRYSLIGARAGSLSLHRLVQAVTRERLALEGQEGRWAAAAVALLRAAFPFQQDVVETWTRSARLLPHALAAAEHAERLDVSPEFTAQLLNRVGGYLMGLALLDAASQALGSSLSVAERVYGPDHPAIAEYANDFGLVLQEQGNLTGALAYVQRALAIDEKAHGAQHPDVARDADNIGTILRNQGDLVGALQFSRRALAIDEVVYGPQHPSVAVRANNIGQILKEQGDLAGALEYARRALEIDEKSYGPKHPGVAVDLNNIAGILRRQGDLDGALNYCRRALAIDEETYGPNHPEVGTDANNIGAILMEQKKLNEALEYTERALRIFAATYGANHAQTRIVAGNAAKIRAALTSA
ncbi:MAG TPA: toll/interleukin-1 receptor domain-containing protein [Bryobacteraceae bacterium]|nr:toll/interleukin-1 receptor domain-containing protein [Bryobacteraceae bacterium]